MTKHTIDYKNRIVSYQSTRFRRRLQVRIVKNTRQPDFKIQPLRVNQNNKYRLSISASFPRNQVLVVEVAPYLGGNGVGPTLNRLEMGRHRYEGDSAVANQTTATTSHHHLEFCLPKSCSMDVSLSFKLYPGGQQVSYQVDELAWHIDRPINPLQPVNAKMQTELQPQQQSETALDADMIEKFQSYMEQIQTLLPAELAREASRDTLDWMKLLEVNANHYRQLLFPWIFSSGIDSREIGDNLEIDQRHQSVAIQALDAWLHGGRSQQWERAQFQLWIEEQKEHADTILKEIREFSDESVSVSVDNESDTHVESYTSVELKTKLDQCAETWQELETEYRELEKHLEGNSLIAKETQRLWQQTDLLGHIYQEFRKNAWNLELIWLQNQRLAASRPAAEDDLEHLQELVEGYQSCLKSELLKLSQLLEEKNCELSDIIEQSAQINRQRSHLEDLRETLVQLADQMQDLHKRQIRSVKHQQLQRARQLALMDQWMTYQLKARLGENLSNRI